MHFSIILVHAVVLNVPCTVCVVRCGTNSPRLSSSFYCGSRGPWLEHHSTDKCCWSRGAGTLVNVSPDARAGRAAVKVVNEMDRTF